MSKVMSAQEAISMIKDGDKIGVGGFIGMGHPQELSVAIEKSFWKQDILRFNGNVLCWCRRWNTRFRIEPHGPRRIIKKNHWWSLGIDSNIPKN